MPRRLLLVVGTRPNFVKVAPVWHALSGASDLELLLLHTGQHYDEALSDRFLTELELPQPDADLGVGSGSHAEQTAAVMIGVERFLAREPADAVLVAGDVNSTMAAALTAAKAGVPVIHLESGLRSADWSMPEEINRVVTDQVSDLLLCPGEDARENLDREGIPRARIAVVGNTMIDSLERLLPAALRAGPRGDLGLEPQGYALVTLHRPALVDDPEQLRPAVRALGELACRLPVLLPLHPRTRARLEQTEDALPSGVIATGPLGYMDFIALQAEARLVITDSGGVQEESSALGVPCLTYRTTTERPVTIARGTNHLVGVDPDRLVALGLEMLATPMPETRPDIPLWDGAAGPRAAAAIVGLLERLPSLEGSRSA